MAVISAEPTYGWALSERLIAAKVIASIGTIYPVVARLQTKGLIETFELAEPAGPKRKYYRLTRRGEAALEAQRLAWAEFILDVGSVLRGNPS